MVCHLFHPRIRKSRCFHRFFYPCSGDPNRVPPQSRACGWPPIWGINFWVTWKLVMSLKNRINRTKDGFLETEVTNSLKVISSKILGCIWACWTKIQSDWLCFAWHSIIWEIWDDRNLLKILKRIRLDVSHHCHCMTWDMSRQIHIQQITVSQQLRLWGALMARNWLTTISCRVTQQGSHNPPRESMNWWCYLNPMAGRPPRLQESWSCPTSSWSWGPGKNVCFFFVWLSTMSSWTSPKIWVYTYLRIPQYHANENWIPSKWLLLLTWHIL